MYSKKSRATVLRELFATRKVVVAPAVGDALGARMVEDAGFPAVIVSGSSMSNLELGTSDVGIMSYGELRNNFVNILNACTIPVIVDADTGYGGKERARTLRGYALDGGNPIFDSLARVGVRPDEVTQVLMTHLHFDHAGGATATGENGIPVPAFPHALYWASGTEWRDALDPEPALRGAYPQENLLPLAEAKRNRAFEDGEEILPGLTVLVTGGHTRGHAAFRIETESEPAYFIGELAPTSLHARQLWNSACDIDQLTSRRVKPIIFSRAFDESAVIYWPHDPCSAASRPARRKGNDFLTEPIL